MRYTNLLFMVLTAAVGVARAQPELRVVQDSTTGRYETIISNIESCDGTGLAMRTVRASDEAYIVDLYDGIGTIFHMCHKEGDRKVGQERFDLFMSRVKEGDPFTAYVVYNQQTNVPLGLFVFDPGSKPGKALLSALFSSADTCITNAVGQAVVSTLIPALRKDGKTIIPRAELGINGEPFTSVECMNNLESFESYMLALSLGMRPFPVSAQNGHIELEPEARIGGVARGGLNQLYPEIVKTINEQHAQKSLLLGQLYKIAIGGHGFKDPHFLTVRVPDSSDRFDCLWEIGVDQLTQQFAVASAQAQHVAEKPRPNPPVASAKPEPATAAPSVDPMVRGDTGSVSRPAPSGNGPSKFVVLQGAQMFPIPTMRLFDQSRERDKGVLNYVLDKCKLRDDTRAVFSKFRNPNAHDQSSLWIIQANEWHSLGLVYLPFNSNEFIRNNVFLFEHNRALFVAVIKAVNSIYIEQAQRVDEGSRSIAAASQLPAVVPTAQAEPVDEKPTETPPVAKLLTEKHPVTGTEYPIISDILVGDRVIATRLCNASDEEFIRTVFQKNIPLNISPDDLRACLAFINNTQRFLRYDTFFCWLIYEQSSGCRLGVAYFTPRWKTHCTNNFLLLTPDQSLVDAVHAAAFDLLP